MKVLWIGDAIVNSGFSIVTHNICNELYQKCDLEVFGIRYDGREKHQYPYHIYPGSFGRDIYSIEFASEVISKTRPDVVVVFNDDHIINSYTTQMMLPSGTRVIPMFPVNMLPINKETVLGFGDATVITYTNFAKNKVREINPNLSISSVYHGVSHEVFKKVDGVKESVGMKNYFVVGTINSNTYRKRLDLFLQGFAKFAKGKSDVRCLIHATNKDYSYELGDIVRDLGISNKTILSTLPRDFVEINALYNMMDVNVNTSMGEGFGLSLIEGAACSVPVLCPSHGNLIDIWTQGAEFIDIEDYEYVAGTRFVGGRISTDSMATKLDKLYEDREYTKELGKLALEHSNESKFSWETVSNKVYKAIFDVNFSKISYIT